MLVLREKKIIYIIIFATLFYYHHLNVYNIICYLLLHTKIKWQLIGYSRCVSMYFQRYGIHRIYHYQKRHTHFRSTHLGLKGGLHMFFEQLAWRIHGTCSETQLAAMNKENIIIT
jgi:hypothetical protein